MDERAKRISEAIENSGLSYPELERITGISKSSLQRYATGVTKKIPIDCIELIAKATGTDAKYLMGWDTESEETEKPSPPDDRWERFRPRYEVLSDAEKAKIDSILDVLLDEAEKEASPDQ